MKIASRGTLRFHVVQLCCFSHSFVALLVVDPMFEYYADFHLRLRYQMMSYYI